MNSPLFFLRRLRGLAPRARLDREMSAEFEEHLARETERNIARGMRPADARWAAQRAFGGVEQLKELERDARGGRWLTDLLRDIRAGARSLAKKPGFVATAVLTLALGLAVNATIFSMISDLLLRPLPAVDPDRLVVMAQNVPKFHVNLPVSYPDFQDFREQIDATATEAPQLARAFSGLMAYREEEVHLSHPARGIERAWVHAASTDYFSVLGIAPQLGRLFLPTEGRAPGADPILVLSDACWRGRFGGDPAIIGQQIKLNGVPFTVVGVTPPGFVGAAWGAAISGFVPITMHPQLSRAQSYMIFARGDSACFMVGRLQPGISLTEARTAANLMMARLIAAHPDYHVAESSLLVLPENRSRPSPYVATRAPFILAALVLLSLLVLAVAVANVANLLYARAADRERELALRGALGASRGRLLRHLLTESVLLALLAGMVGTVSASALQSGLDQNFTPPGFAPGAPMGFDWRLPAFTLLASLVTGLLTGLLPALRATGLDILPLLKADGPGATRTRHPWRSLLVVSQVAASSVVLVCAGLAARSLYQLSQIKLGFDPHRLLVATLDLGRQGYKETDGIKFLDELRRRVRVLPGVSGVTVGEYFPFETPIAGRGDVGAEGEPVPKEANFKVTFTATVDADYLPMLGLPIAEGRGFTEHDTKSAPPVAVISRSLATHLWPKQSAIGQRLVMSQRPPGIEVVGVLGNVRYVNMSSSSERLLFRPFAQHYKGRIKLVVHTASDPLLLISALRQVVRELDPDLPLADLRTLDDHMTRSPSALMLPRLGALVAGSQGVIALLLAALGVFGVVSFAVTRRTREIGIRIALGATPAGVVRLITSESVRLVAIGLAIGLLVALGVGRVLADLLYGISPADPWVFLAVPAIVLPVALVGCWLPISRATRVNPVSVLRAE